MPFLGPYLLGGMDIREGQNWGGIKNIINEFKLYKRQAEFSGEISFNLKGYGIPY